MRKKAQGLSVNTIIIAAIALIVLVVLVAIFTGRLGVFSAGVKSCTNAGGTCLVNCADEEKELFGTDCSDRTDGNTKCCVSI